MPAAKLIKIGKLAFIGGSSAAQSRVNMHIFISYRHRSSRAEATAVRQVLEFSGIAVWQDVDAIDEGGSITSAVDEGLQFAEGAIVLFSHDYLQSGGCFLELAHIVCRLHTDGANWLVLICCPDRDHSHVRPRWLFDLRDGLVTSRADRDGALSRLALAVLSRRAAADGTRAPRPLPKPDLYGAVDVVSALTVPCGHEDHFWRLHDLLHVEASAQTSVGLRRNSVMLSSVPGGGAAELAYCYAGLMGSCFPGGVYWIRDDGDSGSWLASLRAIGDSLGLEAHELHRDRIEGNLSERLRSRGAYLWVVLRRVRADRAGGPLLRVAPTANGKALLVSEGPGELSGSDIVVGPLDRDACQRLLHARGSREPAGDAVEDLAELVYEKSAGHLEAVLGVTELVRVAGVRLTRGELTRRRAGELGLGGYLSAIDRLTGSARELLAALVQLPAEVTITIPVIEALIQRLQRVRPEAPPAVAGYVELVTIGAIAKTPDQSSVFLVRAWREAGKQLTSVAHREQSAIDIAAAAAAVPEGVDLRPHLVRALLEVMPVDTRARQNERLPQIAELAAVLLSEFHSEDDCELAIRCSAIHALYGDYDEELEILESAWEWSLVNLGDDHTRTIELLAEKTQCTSYPRAQAERELYAAYDRLAPEQSDPPRTSLRLRIGLRFAIEIGDGNPGMGLQFLSQAYKPFADSSDIPPLQHVQIRNSIGVFERALWSSDCIQTWQDALAILDGAGLRDRPEATRLQANIASTLADTDPAEAATMARQVFERQLGLYGMSHHLTLWAAVDLLQYSLVAGKWEGALTLMRRHLAPYRHLALGATNVLDVLDVFMRPWDDFDPIPLTRSATLSPEAMRQLSRLPEIVRVTMRARESRTDQHLAPAYTPSEHVLRTLVLLELLEFGSRKHGGDGVRIVILGDFLCRRRRLGAVDWSELQRRLKDYYILFHEYRWHNRETRRVMRRLARELVADLPLWQRWRLRSALQRRGLPAAHL